MAVRLTILPGTVFTLGESILCRDVNADSELQKATSVKTGTMTSLICALFRSPRKRLGVLHLDRGPTQAPFTTEDFYLADAIAANVSVAIETALLIEKQRDEFLLERRKRLEALVGNDPTKRIHFSSHLTGNGPEVFKAAEHIGLEGIVRRLRVRVERG